MSAIHDLIAQVSDPRLRERLAAEWARASKEKKFGLVFEDHLPELLPLYKARPRRGDLVCRRDGSLKDVWQVQQVKDGMATCIKPGHAAQASPSRATEHGVALEPVQWAVDELLVVRQFGEPIFPSLVPVDVVANGPADAPWHALIEADNYHALQLLEYLYAGQVDCIYIDPPYNSGARDWKYNNDYVDENDQWRHSKWLAMMERRLLVAKKLLNPNNSVLIVTIDEKEYLRLGILLEQVFPEAAVQMVSSVINPKGTARTTYFSRTDEFIFFVFLGGAVVPDQSRSGLAHEVRWRYLRRTDVESARGTPKGGPAQFYPIYVNDISHQIDLIGQPLPHGTSRTDAPAIPGCTAVFPIREEDGMEMNWGLTGPSLRKALQAGFVRVSKNGASELQPYVFSYLTAPNIKKLESGKLETQGKRRDGSWIVIDPTGKSSRPTTTWREGKHEAGTYGTSLLREILPGRKFPFPKSLYAVGDALRLFVENKPRALVLDFFAGSGTTLHAVNLLNALDAGRRRCILVTNNEVSAEEAETLRARGLQPGDPDWEELGICRSVTWPRSKYTILGHRDDGTTLAGEYFTGKTVERERARSFTQIGFVDPATLDTTAKKKQVVALIDGLPQTLVKDPCPFIVSEDHKASVLFDVAEAEAWLEALDGQDHITDIYIVTPVKRVFDQLKAQVVELLGPLLVTEDEKRPMSAGFAANLAYFKLDFLDPERVSLRRAFREILPLLWLKAGAVGPRPELKRSEPEPALFTPEGSNLVVLLDETRMGRLLKALASRTGLSHVFIVTDADESFKSMAQDVREVAEKANPGLQVVQLYRDYLLNFMINQSQDRATVQTGVRADVQADAKGARA